jgi:2'-hydroxyisoflavone reductase
VDDRATLVESVTQRRNPDEPSMTTRRDFIKTTAGGVLLGGALPTLARALERDQRGVETAPRSMSILILGGTGFIGPHLVRYATERGHKLTIFTRGQHDAELPASVERLHGDRNGQLDSLKGKKWDAVIDDSATNPTWVQLSTDLLKNSAGAYMFTSSTGVYYPYLKRGIDESVPVHTEAVNPKDGSETYGVAKAQCEQVVMNAFGKRGYVVRPSYIVGPGDTTDRFPYWPVRLARGGEVLAPGHADDPMQLVDVRDLTEFMVQLLENDKPGIYNVAGPREPLTARPFYEAAAKAINPKVKYTFVDDYDFLAAHRIMGSIPWALLRGNDYGMMSVKNDKAIAAGLTFRPLDVTLRDTLAWWPSVPQDRRDKPHFAITPEKEARALADWHAAHG